MPSNRRYRDPSELPRLLPLFPLEGALLLPRGAMPLNVFEPRYLAMVDRALAGDRMIGMIQPLPDGPNLAHPALYGVGCAGRITQYAETGDGRYLISLTGICRFRLLDEVVDDEPFRLANVEYAPFAGDLALEPDDLSIDRAALLATLRKYAERNNYAVDWESVNKAPTLALIDALAMASPFGPREKQALLEAVDPAARADVLMAIAEVEMAGDPLGGRSGLQ